MTWFCRRSLERTRVMPSIPQHRPPNSIKKLNVSKRDCCINWRLLGFHKNLALVKFKMVSLLYPMHFAKPTLQFRFRSSSGRNDFLSQIYDVFVSSLALEPESPVRVYVDEDSRPGLRQRYPNFPSQWKRVCRLEECRTNQSDPQKLYPFLFLFVVAAAVVCCLKIKIVGFVIFCWCQSTSLVVHNSWSVM